MKDVLINDYSYFSKESIERLRKEFRFSQAVHIEMLLWDFEIFTQLSDMHKDLALKGGAATQIYLEPQKQRASRDIDFATTLSKKDIEASLEKIREKFENHKKHENHFRWNPVPPPKDAARRIEDLNCYDIVIPTNFGKSQGMKDATNLRIDAIRYKEIPFVIKTISHPSVFGLSLKPFRIISEGSLIADKLLTLADRTVGILALKEEDYESYLKQLYDLTHLVNKFITDAAVQKDILATLDKLIPIELKYRGLSKKVVDVLKDIVLSLETRRYIDFDQSEPAKEFKYAIDSFQGNYINRSESVILNEWGARIGKIWFIASLILSMKTQGISLERMNSTLDRLQKAETKLESLTGDNLKKIRDDMMQYFKGDKPIEKQLKHAFLRRVLYGVITLENSEEVFKLIGI
jgi:predicted nucleotidyltransferase component of viral defense system